jgi:hypothetical protein
MRIELSIDQLVADGLDRGAADRLVAALTAELQSVLARELAGPAGRRRLSGGQPISVPRLRAALTLPPAGSGPGSGSGAAIGAAAGAAVTGRALGAALGRAVTGDQVFRRGNNR